MSHLALRNRRGTNRMVGSPWRFCLMLVLYFAAGNAVSLSTQAQQPGQQPTAESVAPRIPGYNRFYAENAADPAGGRLLLGELGCVACHALDDLPDPNRPNQLVSPKQAPRLDEIGSRARPEFIRAFIRNPAQVKPGTTMPHLLDDTYSDDQVEAIVHYLASTGQLSHAAPAATSVKRGERTFHEVGCVACHGSPTDDTQSLATSVPLGPLEQKYSIPALAQFLKDPLHVRPSGRMPALNLTDQETRDVASYLLKDIQVPTNLAFQYYEGNWQSLPDFQTLTPKESGRATGLELGNLIQRNNQFGLVITGKIRITEPGSYRFFLSSDDGSRLSINGQKLIENDGIHPTQTREESVELAAGVHQVRVEYFEQGGEEVLRVEVKPPKQPKMPLDALLVSDEPESAQGSPQAFRVDESLVAKGKQLFIDVGCAACHSVKSPLQPMKAPGLADLDTGRGCLADRPGGKLPRYALTSQQRASLRHVLSAVPSLQITPKSQIHQTLVSMNCYACHAREKVGGVERERDRWFATTEPEMGDEGRLPPLLDGVGGKLKKEWLQTVFREGANDRPYMKTRMPRFSDANVGALVEHLVSVDPVAPVTVATDIPVRRLKASGRQLAGSQGFSCIKCHTFGNSRAEGVQALSLTTMSKRLRADWFHRYMLDPQAYRPGTRMPASWPRGQVMLKKILDGTADTQVHALWAYLSDAEKASPPTGLELGKRLIELTASDEPVIYRNFIEGAGPRAIGVGYPERVNLAFDAQQLRLAMIWHNAFIDASRHWTGRGQGFQPPLGDNLLRLPEGPAWAILNEPTAAWPNVELRETAARFGGYELDEKRRPAFLYQVAGVEIRDTMVPLPAESFAPLRRQLSIRPGEQTTGAGAQLYFRAALGKSIVKKQDGHYRIDDSWDLVVSTDEATDVLMVKQGQQMELRIRLDANQKTQTTLEYRW